MAHYATIPAKGYTGNSIGTRYLHPPEDVRVHLNSDYSPRTKGFRWRNQEARADFIEIWNKKETPRE